MSEKFSIFSKFSQCGPKPNGMRIHFLMLSYQSSNLNDDGCSIEILSCSPNCRLLNVAFEILAINCHLVSNDRTGTNRKLSYNIVYETESRQTLILYF